MKIQVFTVNPFGENTYILWNESSKNAAIIDPGCCNSRERDAIKNFIAKEGLNIQHLLNTHMHIDHSAGNHFIEKEYGVKTTCNNGDQSLADIAVEQAQMFGFPYDGGRITICNNVADGDILKVADRECLVLQVPGHSKGLVAYYFPTEGVVFSGDALFKMSIGRTDLPGGDYQELIESIEEKLLTLPRETVVLTGHGPSTTIGFEQTNNPYL